MTPPFATLAPAEAAARVRDGWQVVDVREASERAEGYIAGSSHIALAELSARAVEIDAARPVLVYCRSGARSAMAAEALGGAGYEVGDLEGGLLAWEQAGLPLASDA